MQGGAWSAAVIGGAICLEAAAHGRTLVVASHGPGVMAEYGSVAEYGMQHVEYGSTAIAVFRWYLYLTMSGCWSVPVA